MLIHIERLPSLRARVESEIQNATHGRIRDLKVDDLAGFVTVRGNVPSHHTKQLALQALMDLVQTGRFLALISVRPPEKEQESSELLAKAY